MFPSAMEILYLGSRGSLQGQTPVSVSFKCFFPASGLEISSAQVNNHSRLPPFSCRHRPTKLSCRGSCIAYSVLRGWWWALWRYHEITRL